MLNKWKNPLTTSGGYKTHPMLIVLESLEYYFTFVAKITNMLHVDDNLASYGCKKCTASRSSTLMAELHWRNQNNLTRNSLTCYDCCHYIAQSDTETDKTDKNTAEKTPTGTDYIFKKGGNYVIFLQLGCSIYTNTQYCATEPWVKLGFETIGNEVTGTVQRMWRKFPQKCTTSCTLHC